jgi:hypothetical protein
MFAGQAQEDNLMALIEGVTRFALYRAGEYLAPKRNDRVTPYAQLYASLPNLYTRMEDDDLARWKALVSFVTDVGEFVIKLYKPIDLVGVAYNAYNDFKSFYDTFEGQKDGTSSNIHLTYPDRAFDAIKIAFEAWSQRDDIDGFIADPNPATSASIQRSEIRQAKDVVPSSGTKYDNVWYIDYMVSLEGLARELGDGIYSPDGIPFVFSFQVAGRLSIQHIVTLQIHAPSPPTIARRPQLRGEVGKELTILGDNLEWVKEVTFKQLPVHFRYQNPRQLFITVPGDRNNRQFEPDTGVLDIRIVGGGHASLELTVDYPYPPPKDLVFPAASLRCGDILPVEGVDLRYVEKVEFAGGSLQQPVATTWDERGEAVNVSELLTRWRIYVSVPGGVAGAANLKITTRGGEVTIGPLYILPGAPSIRSARVVEDPLIHIGTRKILLEGENLNYSPLALFGETKATILSMDPDSLTIYVPNGVSQGRVTVVTPYGTAATRERIVLRGGID